MNKKRAYIFGNGSYSDSNFYIDKIKEEENPYIVAVDGGLNFLEKAHLEPDLIIGDLDSVKTGLIQNYPDTELIKHPVKKNETDTELTIDILKDRGIEDVVLSGMLGSRYDHSFGNILLLESCLNKGINAKIIDADNEIFCLRGRKEPYKFEIEPDTVVSLIALTDKVKGVTLKGFEYPLENYTLERLKPGRANSNIAVNEEQSIALDSGDLLVMIINNPE